MQLTQHTDYALRVLIYLTQKPDRLSTIREIAEFYKISENHLMKVVHHLSKNGFIQTTRGKSGGMRLVTPPEQINLGQVIRSTEDNFRLVECFSHERNCCRITGLCTLKFIIAESLDAFCGVYDRYTLADIATTPSIWSQFLTSSPHA